MAETVVADPPPNGTVSAADGYDGLPIPPLDPIFFSQDITLPDSNAVNFADPFDQNDGDVVFDDFDFDLDFSFDDLLPASAEAPLPDPGQFDSDCFVLAGSDPNLTQIPPDRSLRAFKTTSAEFPHVSGENVVSSEAVISISSSPEVCQLSGDRISGERSFGMNQDSGDRGQDVSGYLNVPSPESNGSKGSNDSRVLNCPSPESEGSGNECGSNVSEGSNRSVSSSPNFGNISLKNGVVDQKVKLEELNCSMNNNSLLKRKKGSEELNNSESRTNKFPKSNGNSNNNEENSNSNNNILNEEEDKRRARLMRNRESAQLSRQRKKHYVEELEDKVKNMHSTIQDLNAKISYFMAENATLRQQMGGGGVPPPSMAPPLPGMYPHHPPMMYPWMPVPPYMVKPQGSQVPLVPIPRLKTQQAAPAAKGNKKPESKKSEGKTKKVASVSFLGLLFFILLFGGLVPMVNVRYGGMREAFSGGSDYIESRFYEKHHGRVLTANGNLSDSDYGEKFGGGKDYVEKGNKRNGSEPLVASLYVPRNDKLVKIDGNLIIHSVLASEKAMASRKDAEAGAETRLAVPGDLAPVVPVSGGRHPHLYRSTTEGQRALGSSAGKENLKSTPADGRLQQWFREGLAGNYFQTIY